MSVQKTTIRKQSARPAHTARRQTPVPRLTRILQDLEVTAPADCDMSVILKLVAHDRDHRRYAWWLVVGRYGHDALKGVTYKFTGEDTIRCDLPAGLGLSASTVEPYLAEFLTKEGYEDDPPPVVGTHPK